MGENDALPSAAEVRKQHNLNDAMESVLRSATLHPAWRTKCPGPTAGALTRRGLAVESPVGRGIKLTRLGVTAALALVGERAPTPAPVRAMSVSRGQTVISITPPVPCGLGDCVGELRVSTRNDVIRAHIDDDARRAIIEALGGVLR